MFMLALQRKILLNLPKQLFQKQLLVEVAETYTANYPSYAKMIMLLSFTQMGILKHLFIMKYFH